MLQSGISRNLVVDPTSYLNDKLVASDDLRTLFAAALSQMYRNEVPLYGDLVQIVHRINTEILSKSDSDADGETAQRVSLERHGAIRLGTAYELRTVRRIFNLMGMHAVDYYDLSVAGLPMHATAFRPIDAASLARNPFRVFTTLLRPGLLRDENARRLSEKLLQRRNIFSPRLVELLDIAENQGGSVAADDLEEFICEALMTFRWRPVASATDSEYKQLSQQHPVLADIACFQSAHINHLTPRTLDIEAAHQQMRSAGLDVKASIEGPPKRQNPILLRQTSFLALQEPVQFMADGGNSSMAVVNGHHKARFGEIEERGAVVTPKGRRFYNQVLAEANRQAASKKIPDEKAAAFESAFRAFPDVHERMRAEGLIYCIYVCDSAALAGAALLRDHNKLDRRLIDELVRLQALRTRTITYEDFLPLSAAGIFQSNLQSKPCVSAPVLATEDQSDLEGFECALRARVRQSDALYKSMESESLSRCARKLGITFDPAGFYDDESSSLKKEASLCSD